MNVQTWQRIRDVFDAVVDLPIDQQSTVLERECAGDASLRRRVESLLLCEQDGKLEEIVNSAIQSATQLKDPTSIGNFRILRRLGEGGMGVVYEAEQLQPHRKVAIKLMRSGQLATEREKRLFEREAEALGRLVHGGIATIFESGISEAGHPYLVMEYVEGETLTARLDTLGTAPSFKRADVSTRIELLLQICDAITYAHQRGVIHRDLKPSNIMVTSSGIKLLDFGLARIESEIDNTRTETGIVQGSLRYMSPEQARGEAARIDTRTDIYALGVILYELLSGRHPYLDKTDLLAAVQQICEVSPKPLHTLGRPVDTELETILGKAMAKDPEQRYDSVDAFAGDLRRFLSNQPILARPATLGYQLRKLIARNKLAAGALAAFIILTVAFAIVAVQQAISIRAERDRANQVSDFLVNLFRETNPTETNGTLTAKDLLLNGRKRVNDELKTNPEIRARLLNLIGSAFNTIGPYDQALAAHEESLRISGDNSPETAKAWHGIAAAYYNLGRYKDAATAGRKSLALARATEPPDSENIVGDMNDLALSLASAGEMKEAAALYAEIEQLDHRYKRSDTFDAAKRMGSYGSVLRRLGQNKEAVEKLKYADIHMKNAKQESDHLTVLNNLGLALNSARRYDEAEAVFARATKRTGEIWGLDHPNFGILELNLTFSLLGQKKWDEVAQRWPHLKGILDKALPPKHPTWCDVWSSRAQLEAGRKQYPEAMADWDRALDFSKSVLGPDHFRTRHTALLRARTLAQFGKTEEAVAIASPLLAHPELNDDSRQIGQEILAMANTKH